MRGHPGSGWSLKTMVRSVRALEAMIAVSARRRFPEAFIVELAELPSQFTHVARQRQHDVPVSPQRCSSLHPG